MNDEHLRATDVFGVSRELPMNYVTRPSVDDQFVASLTRDKHVIVFGSSKQGKTSLRKYHLRPDEYVVITCSNKWSLVQLHTAILKQAGFEVELSKSRTESGAAKVAVRAGAKFKLFGQSADAGAEVGGERASSESSTSAALELDPADVNEIISALEGIDFTKFIILEDFHYLPEDTQRDFAVALKAFHESSAFVFIVVGVWLQENRLVQFNGDLAGRVVTVNADTWAKDELKEAISKGETLLNVRFSTSFIDGLLDGSYDSIHVVQESCLKACIDAGINRRVEGAPTVIDADAPEVMKDIVDSQSGRYSEFLGNFAFGFGESTYEMYKWILLPIVMATPQRLERGLPYRWIRRRIDKHHPDAPINAGNVTQALKSIASLQLKLGITPLVLDYNSSLRLLNVVDRSFLVWLRNQPKDELLETIGLPNEMESDWESEEEEEE